MALADQVLQSGTKVTLLSEFETPRRDTAKVFQTLARTHGERVEQLPIEVDSAWVRDWGPLQLSSPHRPLWLDAGYDDDERVRDDVAPAAMGEQLGAEVRAFDWPLDGGAFISNGAGLCVMTLEYLELEGICSEDDDLQQMLANLGCRATAVVPTLPMEDTKHADMIAQFISPTRVLVAQIEADDDIEGSWEESLRLDTAARGIALAAQRLDMDLEIVRVPTPASVDGPVFSFVNGLHLGDRYLMPSYTKVDAARESAAASVIASALGGDKPVVSVDASLPLDSGGALHCLALGVFLN
nr:agmatine deiminase family protein [Pseudenhygromyxa sp. WMMC2535]